MSITRLTIRGPRVSIHTRWVMAIAGGALMGWGAALARGCTSGQALSGGAVLGAGSWAFMMMVFAGVWVAPTHRAHPSHGKSPYMAEE